MYDTIGVLQTKCRFPIPDIGTVGILREIYFINGQILDLHAVQLKIVLRNLQAMNVLSSDSARIVVNYTLRNKTLFR